MQTAIKATQLSKSYGRLLAVDHISLSVKYGTVYGLLGANGVGKSIVMECILETSSCTRFEGAYLALSGEEDKEE